MILVIDSGATNSTWKFISSQSDQAKIYRRGGINLATSDLEKVEFDFPKELKSQVLKIFYFGAGVGISEKEQLLKAKLLQNFENHTFVRIETDLTSAGFALSLGVESVIAIIGTGSNCGVFDGSKISQPINNLGYLLGDEGGGFRMGRKILQDYFYKLMPAKDINSFSVVYNLTRNDLIKKVYHEGQHPNRYIASFTQFLQSCSEEYRREVAIKQLNLFFHKQLNQLEGAKHLPHHFSGSISFHFREEIEELCVKYKFKLGKIIQNPIDSLSYSKLVDLL